MFIITFAITVMEEKEESEKRQHVHICYLCICICVCLFRVHLSFVRPGPRS